MVVLCEELVNDVGELGDGGAPAELTEPLVSHVVRAPRGAAPGACLPCYEADWRALLDHTALERNEVAGWRARLERP